ncbi:hypothetical protein [Paraburkholderia unamae]|uniref:Uncharacterized protein n=1 Tax=Paraburkholderia unamae TaxID=219649 RepID=A0ACC6RH51_9BURK
MSDELPVVFDPYANTGLSWPAEMVAALAQGLEDPADVAARFGYEGDRWVALSSNPAFLRAVEGVKAELMAEGWVLRTKAKAYAEILQDELAKRAAQPDTPLTQQLAVYEALCKTGDVLPKAKTQTGNTGPSFSISINLDRATVEASVKRPTNVIDVEAKEVKE